MRRQWRLRSRHSLQAKRSRLARQPPSAWLPPARPHLTTSGTRTAQLFLERLSPTTPRQRRPVLTTGHSLLSSSATRPEVRLAARPPLQSTQLRWHPRSPRSPPARPSRQVRLPPSAWSPVAPPPSAISGRKTVWRSLGRPPPATPVQSQRVLTTERCSPWWSAIPPEVSLAV